MCPICKSEMSKILLNWKKYKINKCGNCKLIFATPLPLQSELEEFYQGFLFKKPDKNAIQNRVEKTKRELIKIFKLSGKKNHLSEKYFLDYGGGTGIGFMAATELGLQVFYHDIDKHATEFTMQNFGLKPQNIVEDISKCAIWFDYILSDNVIEHVPYPLTFINNLLNRLNEGGIIVLKTPNAGNSENYFNPLISLKEYTVKSAKYNSIGGILYGYFNRFWHCDPPRHIYSFSKKSFFYLMNSFESSNIEFEISNYKIPWFAHTVTKQFFSKDKRLNPFASILVRLIIWPIIPVETLLQVIRHFLLWAGFLSPGGLILIIKKTGS